MHITFLDPGKNVSGEVKNVSTMTSYRAEASKGLVGGDSLLKTAMAVASGVQKMSRITPRGVEVLLGHLMTSMEGGATEKKQVLFMRQEQKQQTEQLSNVQ